MRKLDTITIIFFLLFLFIIHFIMKSIFKLHTFKTQQTSPSKQRTWATILKPAYKSTAEGYRYNSGVFCTVFHCCFFPLHWILYTWCIFTLPSALKCSDWNKFESLPHKTLCLFGHYSRPLLLPLCRYPMIVFLQFKQLNINY